MLTSSTCRNTQKTLLQLYATTRWPRPGIIIIPPDRFLNDYDQNPKCLCAVYLRGLTTTTHGTDIIILRFLTNKHNNEKEKFQTFRRFFFNGQHKCRYSDFLNETILNIFLKTRLAQLFENDMQSNVGTETNPSIKSPFQFQIIVWKLDAIGSGLEIERK